MQYFEPKRLRLLKRVDEVPELRDRLLSQTLICLYSGLLGELTKARIVLSGFFQVCIHGSRVAEGSAVDEEPSKVAPVEDDLVDMRGEVANAIDIAGGVKVGVRPSRQSLRRLPLSPRPPIGGWRVSA